MTPFRFSLHVFLRNCFDRKLVHRSYQGKGVCDGWILVDSRRRRWWCGQEGLLMLGSRWRLYPLYEDLFMLDFWFWCCWWMNCWIFNYCLRFKLCHFDFVIDTHLFNPLFKRWGEFRNTILVWCCGNGVSFSIQRFWSESNQFISNEFWWKIVCCFFYLCGVFWEEQRSLFEINQFNFIHPSQFLVLF